MEDLSRLNDIFLSAMKTLNKIDNIFSIANGSVAYVRDNYPCYARIKNKINISLDGSKSNHLIINISNHDFKYTKKHNLKVIGSNKGIHNIDDYYSLHHDEEYIDKFQDVLDWCKRKLNSYTDKLVILYNFKKCETRITVFNNRDYKLISVIFKNKTSFL